MNFLFIITGFLLLTTGCPVGGTLEGGSGSFLIDTVDINVTINSQSQLPANSRLILVDEGGIEVALLPAESTGTYTFTGVDVQYLNQTKRVYSLYIFSDSNTNDAYDADSEADTYTLLEVILMSAYGTDDIDLDYTLNKYSGTITYHADFGADTSKRYVLYTTTTVNLGTAFSVNNDGSFTFYYVRTEAEVLLSIYTFYDTNGDGAADELSDTLCYMLTQSNQNHNTSINLQMVQAYGTVEYMGADSRFDFDSATNPPVLSVEDQSYWRTFYQPLETDGSFKVYGIKNHVIDIRVNHVASTISDYAADYKTSLLFPVRVAGATSYSADKEIFGVGGTGTTVKIYTVGIKIANPDFNLTDKQIYILAGQSAITFPLYTGDSTTVSGAVDASGTNYTVYFRSFDRTTSTSGIFNDATLATTTQGYGAFYNVRAFIDLNADKTLSPEDPRSNIYYYGDTDGDDAPTWGPDPPATTDLYDTASPSYITANADFTGSTLTIAAP